MDMEYMKSLFELVFPTKNLYFICNADDLNIENHICKACKDNIDIVNKEVFLDPSLVEECYYTSIYDRFMKDIIKRYKFDDKSFLYKPLGSILLETVYEKNLDKKVDLIAFVPSHRRKEAIRGYNQSELLAKFISEELNIPLSRTLIKTNHTVDQHFLDREARKKNLKKAFKVKNTEEIEGRKILLIDDLITSGSTIEESARELIKNKAKAVFALALTSSRKI